MARALEAALTTGDEGSSAWRDRFDDLWRAFQIPVERVAADGGLAEGWTPDTATDWIWAQVQPASYEHLVEVHIANLRRKLGDDPHNPRYVCTVRGVGYRMGPGR